MKILKSCIVAIFSIAMISSCKVDDNVDNKVPVTEADAGSLIEFKGTAKLLGVPVDPANLETSEVNIQEFLIDLKIKSLFPTIPDEVVEYTLYKSYNGGEKVELAKFPNVSYEYKLDDLTKLLEGLNVTKEDLRIGDEIKLSVSMKQKSGKLFFSNKTYNVVVNCLSNLAGEYQIVFTSGPKIITVTEKAPGVYRADYLPTFSADYWWEFTDVCGTLTPIDFQYQGSNPLTGTGVVLPNGDLKFSGMSVGGVSWYVNKEFTIEKVTK